MEARATEAGEYWQNFLTFQADLGADRERELESIAQMERFGTLAPEQASARRQEVESSYAEGMTALKQGPTYQLLQSEFEAQRDFAQAEHDRQYGAYVPGRDPTGAADPTSEGYVGDGVGMGAQDPRGPAPPMEFAQTMEEYFGARFGTEGRATPRPASSPSAASGRRPTAGGTGTTQGIGVGATYSWY